MNKLQKELCKSERKMSEAQFLTDIYLLLKNEYIAEVHCNGEKVRIKLLNGQKFDINVKEA